MVVPVLRHVEQGDHTAAAAEFVGIVVGPGAWEAMPAAARDVLAANAPTFAGEVRDPRWADIDLDGLRTLDAPVLLTNGDQSPPFFAEIVEALASALPTASKRTLAGAGHVPHETHPREYAAVVTEFLGTPTRAPGP
jgi:pimeloyl-ACP methyl ester carboxylesterase